MILNWPSANPGSTQDYLPRIPNHQPNRGDPPRTDFPEALASPAEPAGAAPAGHHRPRQSQGLFHSHAPLTCQRTRNTSRAPAGLSGCLSWSCGAIKQIDIL